MVGRPRSRPRGGGGAEVVRVGAAEGEQRAAGRGLQVGGQLAPLVADELRMDQVVPLEEQPDAMAREALVRDLLEGEGSRGLRPVAGSGAEGWPVTCPLSDK